jgi:phospholipid/cholesterol/gamma-HCH transport system permease protein
VTIAAERAAHEGGAVNKGGDWWEFDDSRGVLRLGGAWRLAELHAISQTLPATAVEPALAPARRMLARSRPSDSPLVVDGQGLQALDTAAALFLCRLLIARGIDPAAVSLERFDPRHERTWQQVVRLGSGTDAPASGAEQPFISRLGRGVLAAFEQMLGYVAFLGLALAEIGRALLKPSIFRGGELLTQMARICVAALPVVALVTALIGLVFAYLLGLQAEQFGANIFVVDGVSLGMTREFSPLIVAVIVAGRSGASFAAQLGTMRLNEETDAIQVLGLSVAQVLIVPRVLALVLSLPLLVFVGDLAGLAGAAIIADLMLGISPTAFIDRLQYALMPRHAIIGLLKAPFFALLIAVIGCRLGMSGPRDTRTIGVNTTSTVVQSIVGVIVIDALFAVLLQEMGL